jgi:hypothetical protein
MNCCVCGRAGTNHHVIKITESEKEAIRNLGVEPDEEYVYCQPCIGILRHKEAGARLIQGVVRNNLASQGHPQPDEAASTVYERLVGKRGLYPKSLS